MKKVHLLSLVLLLSVAFSGTVYAKEQGGPLGLTGFGVYGSFGTTMGGGVGLSLKWASFPVIGLKYNFGNQFNISADYYVVDGEGLASSLSYYIGAGLYAGYSASNSSNPFAFGLRIPVGLQFWPVKKLELFLAPVLSIPLFPTPTLDLGVELGARVRF